MAAATWVDGESWGDATYGAAGALYDGSGSSAPGHHVHLFYESLWFILVAAGVSAGMAVAGILVYRRTSREPRARMFSRQGLLDAPLLAAVSDGQRRMEWCRKLVMSAIGLFIITSEFTGTAFVLWFGHDTLEKFKPWLEEQKEAGIGVFLGVWVVAMLCCAPSTPLWLLGGFCFKGQFFEGLGLNVAGCWLSSMVCFGLGRTACSRCQRYQCCQLGGDSSQDGGPTGTLAVLNQLMYKNPIAATILSRLAFAPMAVKNYGFGGFSPVPTHIFMLCTLVGDFPNTVLFTHLGGTVSDIADAIDGKTQLGIGPKVGLGVSVAVTGGFIGLVTFLARREMKRQQAALRQGNVQ